MSEPKNDSSDIPSTIPCPTCRKPIPFPAMEGPTKFGITAVTCPYCKNQHFVEVTTEVDPDPRHPQH